MITHKPCPTCKASFPCGSTTANQPCWCSQLPPIMPVENDQDCRCPRCLKIIIKEKITDFVQNNPVQVAIPSQYHSKELVQEIDYYIEEGK